MIVIMLTHSMTKTLFKLQMLLRARHKSIKPQFNFCAFYLLCLFSYSYVLNDHIKRFPFHVSLKSHLACVVCVSSKTTNKQKQKWNDIQRKVIWLGSFVLSERTRAISCLDLPRQRKIKEWKWCITDDGHF